MKMMILKMHENNQEETLIVCLLFCYSYSYSLALGYNAITNTITLHYSIIASKTFVDNPEKHKGWKPPLSLQRKYLEEHP